MANRMKYAIKKLKPSPFSVAYRLPETYTKFQKELEKTPQAVHYIPEEGKWKTHPFYGTPMRVENVPIPLKFPKEADEGIWGGEGVIQGFIQPSHQRRKHPKFWVPSLKRAIVYSQILNKYMSVTVTERTLVLIDKHFGFDNYILETPVQDLKSQLALDLRRIMLLALVNKEVNYEDPTEQEKVWQKYEKFEVPKEEAEWFGLHFKEAIQKQRLLEEEPSRKPQPLKHHFRQLFIQELKQKKAQKMKDLQNQKSSGISGFLSKVPFIGRKKQEN